MHWRKFFLKKKKKEKEKRKKNACLWKMKNGEKKKNSNINNKGKMYTDGIWWLIYIYILLC